MTYSQAIDEATEAMEKIRKGIAFDANIASRSQDPYPYAKKALRKYNRLKLAIETLQLLKQEIKGQRLI